MDNYQSNLQLNTPAHLAVEESGHLAYDKNEPILHTSRVNFTDPN